MRTSTSVCSSWSRLSGTESVGHAWGGRSPVPRVTTERAAEARPETLSQTYRTVADQQELQSRLEELSLLEQVRPDWASRVEAPPNQLAMYRAERALRLAAAHLSVADTVVAAADGGVALAWTRDGWYAELVLHNDGDIVLAHRRRGERTTIVEVSVEALPSQATWAPICAYADAS